MEPALSKQLIVEEDTKSAQPLKCYTLRQVNHNYLLQHASILLNNLSIEIVSRITIYLCTVGGSDDWAKGGAGIKYSYTVELPDTGSYGFLLPSSRIEKVGRETHAGFIAMLQQLLRNKTG